MSCNPNHSKHSAKQRYVQTPNSDTLNTELQNTTPNQIMIHPGPNLCIWISLLHPYISYCLYCSCFCICSITPVPLTLLSCTCSILNVPHYDPSVSFMSVLLKTIKSQCHVIIPQFKYQNHLGLTLVQLRLVLTLPLALPYSYYSLVLPHLI